MKTFFAVLAAILTAGVIFLMGFGLVAHFQEWETRKDAVVTYLRSSSQSADSLDSALTRREHQALGVLKSLLENKPFLALNADEKKWLKWATEDAQKEKTAARSSEVAVGPTPTQTPVAEWAILTLEASVYDANKAEIHIPAGTKLKVVSHSEHDITFEYGGETYSLPVALTDFKKY
jgi:hypothetical protein